MDPTKFREQIHQLLAGQRLAVLSTSEMGRPYASLVAFYFSPDLRFVCFATTRSTRKYANLKNQPQVAFLIDSRSNQEEDFHQAAAVTVIGQSRELDGEERQRAADLYLLRHPYLEEFIEAPTTAFFTVHVEKYIHVSRFQEVFEYLVTDAPDITP